MEVTATAKHLRVSPQKVRIVADQIKKMEPQEAVDVLSLVNKRSALPLKKVIASAIANAKHNFGLEPKSLVFKSVLVGQGRMLKRYRAVSRGRAHEILRKTSHIQVVLEGEKYKTNQTNKTNKSDKSDKKGDEKANNGPKN